MKITVIGIGNTLMADDGIGLLVLDRLKEQYEGREDIEFIPLATGGMDLLHVLPGLDIAMIIDAGDFGGEPGDHQMFSPEDVVSVKPIRGYSLHELDIMRVLKLSKEMGEAPEEIHIMAIQPEKVCYNEEMTQVLLDNLNDYVEVLAGLIDGFS
ncbi:MAG: hydrogenase maturation protease [Thermoplasmata archaeon]|nr:hydrogenase maturation protease [Thermoplasmata archaeon]